MLQQIDWQAAGDRGSRAVFACLYATVLGTGLNLLGYGDLLTGLVSGVAGMALWKDIL